MYVCMYIYIYICVYIYIYTHTYTYRINLQTAAVSLFESSSAQLRSNEDLEGPECSNYHESSGHSISLVATLLDQQSAQVKEYYIGSVCRQHIRQLIYIYIWIYRYI